jgi:hypothetical protein
MQERCVRCPARLPDLGGGTATIPKLGKRTALDKQHLEIGMTLSPKMRKRGVQQS